jgi:2-dehydropantoate 2-reductase
VSRRYVVVGCGAIGGLYGARLVAAGHDVTFVVRADVDSLRTGGLRLKSVDGDLDLAAGTFGVASSPADAGAADVVVLATKATSAVDVSPSFGPSTTLAVFQNGLGVEAAADDRSPGAGAVVGAMCFVCAAKVGPNVVRHDAYGRVTLAPLRGGVGAAEAIGDDLSAAGVPVEVTGDLTTARWRKLLWNVPFNGLTAVRGVGTDELLADMASRALVVAIMDEVVATAQANGASLDSADADAMVAMTEAMVPYRTSMALDLEAGRPLELDTIHRAVLRAATVAGVDMPHTEALLGELEALDARAST